MYLVQIAVCFIGRKHFIIYNIYKFVCFIIIFRYYFILSLHSFLQNVMNVNKISLLYNLLMLSEDVLLRVRRQ